MHSPTHAASPPQRAYIATIMSTVEENKAPQQPVEMDLANTPLKNAESDGKRVRTEDAGSPMDEVSDESPPKKTKDDETATSATVEKTDDEAASAAKPDSTTGGDATNVEEKSDATDVDEKTDATNVDEKAAAAEEKPAQPDTSEA